MRARELDPGYCRDITAGDRWRTTAGPDGCIDWAGTHNGRGYGQVSIHGAMAYAHRVAWVAAHGQDIPEGLVIDHLCRRPSCVNPQHLEVVPPGENVLRGTGPTAVNKTRTHCPRGHAYMDSNITASSRRRDRRDCLTCNRDRDARRHRLVSAAARRLGVPRSEYVTEYGSSLHTAKRVLLADLREQMAAIMDDTRGPAPVVDPAMDAIAARIHSNMVAV